jgi:thioredoxin-related protein
VIDNRRKGVAVILATIILLNMACTRLAAAGVQLAIDLHKEARQAEQACVPLLLEFAAQHCGYCTLLEEEILNPTLLNRDYDRRVLMRKLVIDGSSTLRDFNTTAVSAAELASRYRILVTPTLLFVDSQGDELAERMVGVMTLEFYGGYLDQALDTSSEKLRELERCK